MRRPERCGQPIVVKRGGREKASNQVAARKQATMVATGKQVRDMVVIVAEGEWHGWHVKSLASGMECDRVVMDRVCETRGVYDQLCFL